MRVFFDTSALVPVFSADHLHHDPSLNRLASLRKGQGGCSAHTLAEVYATLTRMPIRPRVTPTQAWNAIEELCGVLTVVELSAEEYRETLRGLSRRGFLGGITYDAIAVAAAMKWKARILYTWNLRDMQRIAEGQTTSVVTPE